MKTIIMRDPYPEYPGSRFPMVRVTAFDAEKIARDNGARLPTSEEYDRLFATDPWPYLVWEWMVIVEGLYWVLRGGAWLDDARLVRAARRLARHPGSRDAYVGFRLARDIPDDAPVPDGWLAI